MSRAPKRRLRWRVRRSFEINRLAQTNLEAAYAQIVPVHIRIVSSRPVQTGRRQDGGEPVRRERRAV